VSDGHLTDTSITLQAVQFLVGEVCLVQRFLGSTFSFPDLHLLRDLMLGKSNDFAHQNNLLEMTVVLTDCTPQADTHPREPGPRGRNRRTLGVRRRSQRTSWIGSFTRHIYPALLCLVICCSELLCLPNSIVSVHNGVAGRGDVQVCDPRNSLAVLVIGGLTEWGRILVHQYVCSRRPVLLNG
jgi:hypothetical protein